MEAKEKWIKYTQNSTFHGLSQAFDQERKLGRRIIWLVMISGAFLFLVYTLSFGVIKLLHPEYTTQISIKRASSIPFPSITFCSNNMYRRSYVENNPDVFAYIMNSALQDAPYLTDNKTLIAQAEAVSLTDMDQEKLTLKLIEASHLTSDTIYVSKALGETVQRSEFVAELTSKGMCYTFNMTRDVKQAGVDSVGILLVVNSDEYFYNSEGLGAMGIKVLPHSAGALPEVKSRGIGGAAKMETMISMQKTVTYLLPESGCIPEGSNTLDFYDTYSQSACMNECSVKHQVNMCGCKYFYDPGNYTLCLTSDDFLCVNALPRNDSYPTKSCDCPPKCVEETFDCKVSAMPFPSQYAKGFYDRKGFKMLTQNWHQTAKISIFFETLDVISIVEKRSYTTDDFFSDVGGLMGLWLGASVITWTELIEVLINILWGNTKQSA